MNATAFPDTTPIPLGASPAIREDHAGPAHHGVTPLVFHGSGGEYFKIWIVNLVLSVLTLGIYSAWAKVRTQQYFHSNTELAGSRFAYHGRPRSILIGRGLVAGLFLTAVALAQLGSPTAIGFFAVGIVLIPWLMAGSMRFRAAMVSWRGVRFAWHGTTGSVYRLTLKVIGFTLITFGIYYFAGHHRFKRLLIDDLYFGDIAFEAKSTSGSFFGPYWIFGVVTTAASKLIDASSLLQAESFGDNAASMVVSGLSIGIFYVSYKVLSAVLSKIVQNKTTLGNLHLQNTSTVSSLIALYAANASLITLTLGLYWPWASIREMQYRASHFEVLGDIGRLQASNTSAEGNTAIGQEAAGLFDFDVSF
jgi:uncharacterized membrane protein YjgN (DUF898 family)